MRCHREIGRSHHVQGSRPPDLPVKSDLSPRSAAPSYCGTMMGAQLLNPIEVSIRKCEETVWRSL